MQTGLQLVIEQPGKLLDGGLRSEDVINLANSSHATFYRKFATKSRYLAEVLNQLVDSSTSLPDDIRTEVEAALKAADGDRRRAVRALVQDHFERVFNDETSTRRLLAMVLGPTEPRAARTMQAVYRRTDALTLQIFEILFAQSGATLRKPLNSKSFCVVLTALLDGFLIRHRAEPRAVTAELVADAVLAMLNITVDNMQRHGHIDDALTAFEAPRRLPATLPSEPRAAMIDAARTEFGKRGYFMATIDAIAAEAGVPLDAALRIFPTKAHIIVGAMKAGYDKLRQGIEDDIALGHEVISVAEHHFLRCARLAAEERAYMDALMAAVAHDTYAEPDGLISIKRELNFPALLTPLIEGGQRDGVFADDQPAAELAALLTNTLLLRCFTRRTDSPEQNASFVFRLALDGLRKN